MIVAIPDDEEFNGWRAPDYTVDDRGKVVDAVPGARNNWGRWGGDDQRGTANLCTPVRIREACLTVTRGERFSYLAFLTCIGAGPLPPAG